jgi:cyclic pyranopterin phosphate synthase
VFGKEFILNKLEDQFGRKFPYLRLSITDVCNFRCTYCLPDGYKKSCAPDFMNVGEIERLVNVFAELGTSKIRITGGEPTVRKNFIDIARTISSTEGIRKTALTTNGYKLPQRVQSFYDAGLRALNISVDSFDPQLFHKITGHNRLSEVLEGIDAAISTGFDSVKINTVLLKNQNDNDMSSYMDFIRERDISIRFIELMQTGDNQDFFKKKHVRSDVISNYLLSEGWIVQSRGDDAGPAIEYRHPDYVGSIGIIAPYSKDFCKSCNRLRITAHGDLRLCLFGNGGYSLRHLLQRDDQKEELKDTIVNLLYFKHSSHFLAQGDTGATSNLALLGG